jgi:hypothetical protein
VSVCNTPQTIRLSSANCCHRFTFTITLLPYPLFCLTQLIAMLGIYTKAFEAEDKSVDDMLNRPDLEDAMLPLFSVVCIPNCILRLLV